MKVSIRITISVLLLILILGCNRSHSNYIQESLISLNFYSVLDSVIFSEYNDSNRKFEPYMLTLLEYNYDKYPIFTKNYFWHNEKKEWILMSEIRSNSKNNNLESIDIIAKGELIVKQLFSYNQNGNVTSVKVFNKENKLIEYEESIYSERNIISQNEYTITAENELRIKSNIENKYDESNRKIISILSVGNDSDTSFYNYNDFSTIPDLISKKELQYFIKSKNEDIIEVTRKYKDHFPKEYRSEFSCKIVYNENRKITEYNTFYGNKSQNMRYNYDEFGNLIQLVVNKNEDDETHYIKYEFGKYAKSKYFIYPPWYAEVGILTNSIIFNFEEAINEENFENVKKPKLNKIMNSFPTSYISYKSYDGTNWKKNEKIDYKFKKIETK